MSYEQIVSLLPERREEYDTLLTIKYMERQNETIFCPNSECSSVFLGTGTSKIECHDCQTTVCFTCKTSHQGSCNESLLKNDSLFREMTVKGHTKKCPKCNYYIEKSVGCNHMTCRMCQHEFCWKCNSEDYKWCPCKLFEEEGLPSDYPVLWRMLAVDIRIEPETQHQNLSATRA